MSYTNAALVRKHIEFVQPVLQIITNQQMSFTDNEYQSFFSGQIIAGSVTVKSLKEYKQQIANHIVTDGENVISPLPLVNGSVLCSTNSSLTKIYKENIDYIIDYTKGTVTFPSSGDISNDDMVTFFFLPYFPYQENSDFKINYETGKIALPVSSKIKFGEVVYIDYQPAAVFHSDTIIDNAVVEANAIIEQTVDPNKQFGANLVLQTAATYRALEILCRSSAAKELASQTGRESSAKAWISLGEVYLARSAELIRSFTEPVSQISNPTHS
ncbi:MAG: hypothetical protein DWP97_06110 [Calditrichaeota bacterium]|nr:MAG: hypothetical protein DWP97_06110 [Calditrichota bacterium]